MKRRKVHARYFWMFALVGGGSLACAESFSTSRDTEENDTFNSDTDTDADADADADSDTSDEPSYRLDPETGLMWYEHQTLTRKFRTTSCGDTTSWISTSK